MGEDTIVYIERDSLKKWIQTGTIRELMRILEIDGMRFWAFKETYLGDKDTVGEYFTSQEIIHILATTNKKIAGREEIASICLKYNLIFIGEYSKYKPPETYIDVDTIKRKIREAIGEMIIEV